MHANDGAFGHVRMAGNHTFNAAGRQAVSGDVDNVVGAAHDENVAVLIFITGIGRQIVALVAGQIRLVEAVIVVPKGGQRARRQRQLHHNIADFVRRGFVFIIV